MDNGAPDYYQIFRDEPRLIPAILPLLENLKNEYYGVDRAHSMARKEGIPIGLAAQVCHRLWYELAAIEANIEHIVNQENVNGERPATDE